VLLVARWALRELALARLGFLAEVSDERSQQVAEHSGFQREGVLRSYAEIDGRASITCRSRSFQLTSLAAPVIQGLDPQ
jgi:RimJ/RimL family protein N-acetyltransferase